MCVGVCFFPSDGAADNESSRAHYVEKRLLLPIQTTPLELEKSHNDTNARQRWDKLHPARHSATLILFDITEWAQQFKFIELNKLKHIPKWKTYATKI